MLIRIVIFVLMFVIIPLTRAEAAGDVCTESMVLDGSEVLVSYGLDSTKNWWAITSPFEAMSRLWVNGKKSAPYQALSSLQFSPDGEHWAAWAQYNNLWSLLVDGSVQSIQCTAPGELRFSTQTQALAYSYFDGSQEMIVLKNKKYAVVGRTGQLYLSPSADKSAFVIGQLGSKALVINGKQGPFLDDVKPFGFWTDGQFMYAALSGAQWRIYRGEDELAGPYADVSEFAINNAGTVAAAIVVQGSNKEVILFSDDYTRPVESRQYPVLDALVLHPTLPMWGARSQQVANALVVMTGTDYSAGSQGTGRPMFSSDGSELLYFGCDTDCFISINGRKMSINQAISMDGTFAHKAKSTTFAFSSTTSLIIREIERQDLWVSKMCDETSLPRYNWRRDAYEALGRINQRLYLLSCMK